MYGFNVLCKSLCPFVRPSVERRAKSSPFLLLLKEQETFLRSQLDSARRLPIPSWFNKRI